MGFCIHEMFCIKSSCTTPQTSASNITIELNQHVCKTVSMKISQNEYVLHGYCLGLHNIVQVFLFEVYFSHCLKVADIKAYFLFLVYISLSWCWWKSKLQLSYWVKMLHTYLTAVRGLLGPTAGVNRPAGWTCWGANKYLTNLWVVLLDSQQ